MKRIIMQQKEEKKQKEKIEKEMKEKREEKVKHYELENKEMIAKVYEEAVHYYQKEEKRYREIDNRFEAKEEEYQTKYNCFQVRIPKRRKKQIYEIQKEDTTIKIECEGEVETIQIKEGKERNEGKAIFKRNEKEELEILVKGNKIKSNIVLKERGTYPEYCFYLKTTNLRVVYNEEKEEIEFYHKKKNTLEYVLKAPLMYDGNQEYSEDIWYEIEKRNEDYQITMKANQAWIEDKNRIYPITLDPEIVVQSQEETIRSYQSVGTQVSRAPQIVEFGKKEATKIMRGYYTFNLPFLKSNMVVVEAIFKLKIKKYASGLYYSVHELTSNVQEGNTLPSYKSQAIIQNRYPDSNILCIDITSMLQQRNFKGIVIKAHDEEGNELKIGQLGGEESINDAPLLEIKYYEKQLFKNERNMKSYPFNEKGQLKLSLIDASKRFEQEDLTIGEFKYGHLFCEMVNHNQANIPLKKKPMGVFHHNFHTYLFHKNRVSEEESDVIYQVDIDSQVHPFKKRYYYEEEGNEHFVLKEEVQQKGFNLIYIDKQQQEHEVHFYYEDERQKKLIVDEPRAKLIKTIFENKQKQYYYLDKNKKRVDIKVNKDLRFEYEVALLESDLKYYVDIDFITKNEKEEDVFLLNEQEFKVKEYKKVIKRIKKYDEEEMIVSNSLYYNQKGELESTLYLKKVYFDYPIECNVDLAYAHLEDETKAYHQFLMECYQYQEELQSQYNQYQSYQQKSITELQDKYQKLQQENFKQQIEINEYQMSEQLEQLNKQKVELEEKIEKQNGEFNQAIEKMSDDEILQLFKNLPGFKSFLEVLGEENFVRFIRYYKTEEEVAYEKTKQQINQIYSQQQIQRNQEEMNFLQCLINQETQQQKEIYIQQLKDRIHLQENKINEIKHLLEKNIQKEKEKPMDYLITANQILGFDYDGKLVYFNQNQKEYFLIYQDDQLCFITNKEKEKLLSFQYENNQIVEVKDCYGRKVHYEYEDWKLIKVTHSDKDFILYHYNDIGLYEISDSAGHCISTYPGKVNIYSQIATIKNDQIIQKEKELETSDTIYVHYPCATLTNQNNQQTHYIFDDFANPSTIYETSNLSSQTKNSLNNAFCFFQNEEEEYALTLNETSKNYLINGSFENENSSFETQGNVTLVTNETISGSKSLKMSGNTVILKQTLLSSSLNNHKAFVFSGWAKASNSLYVTKTQQMLEDESNLDLSSSAHFELRVEINYQDGTKQIRRTTFDFTNTNWQLVCVPFFIDSNKTLTNVVVLFDFSNNQGEVLLDHFKVSQAIGYYQSFNADHSLHFKTDFITSTLYKKYHNKLPLIIEETDEKQNVTTYHHTYDLDGNLIKVVDSKGIVHEFLFDDSSNTQKTLTYHQDNPTSAFSIYQTFDEYGRLIHEKSKKEDPAISYHYKDSISSLMVSTQVGNQSTFLGYDSSLSHLIAKSHNQDSLLFHYTLGFLTQVQDQNGSSLHFEYDKNGNQTKVLLNNQELRQTLVEENVEVSNFVNGKYIKEMGKKVTHSFPNGKKYQFIYNQKGDISQFLAPYSSSPLTSALSFEYNNKGQLLSIEDDITLQLTRFTYNQDGLLEKVKTPLLETSYSYDDFKNVNSLSYKLDENNIFTYSFNLDEYESTLPNSLKIHTKLDNLHRLSLKSFSLNNQLLASQSFSYLNSQNETSPLIYQIQTFINHSRKEILSYTYDSFNNISSVSSNGKEIHHFIYDDNNQLIQEDNLFSHHSFFYSYDSNKNIISKEVFDSSNHSLIQSNSFIYDDNNRLLSFNGELCLYDNLGHPLIYRNKECGYGRFPFLYKFGDVTFNYNVFGCRTTKNQVQYMYDSSNRLLKEVNSNHTLYFFYEDNQVSCIRVDGMDYLLIRNLFNDVTHIYDLNGNLCASYLYDAWGNHIVLDASGNENTNPDFIGNLNPIRYRGYYFDKETNLYFLKSRYYDPEVGRFISPDSVDFIDPYSFFGFNLYAYCKNNPVNYFDESGHMPMLLLFGGLLFGTIAASVFNIAKQMIQNDWDFSTLDWGSVVNSAIVGGALGLSLAFGIAYLGPVIAGTATTGGLTAGSAFAINTAVSFGAGNLGYVFEELINGRTPSFGKAIMHGGFVMIEGMVSFGVGGITGSVGTIGKKGKLLLSKEWWLKFIFGQEFTQPFKIGIDSIRKNI